MTHSNSEMKRVCLSPKMLTRCVLTIPQRASNFSNQPRPTTDKIPDETTT